jgi:hypothetical protein
MNTWTVKHKRTGHEFGEFKTIDEAIDFIRANDLRVWATDRPRQTVNVVEDERKVRQSH